MSAVAPIPVDRLLDQVLSALERGDASALEQLEGAANCVTAPESLAQYRAKRDTLAMLLEMTARNLRLMRCAADRNLSGPYALIPR